MQVDRISVSIKFSKDVGSGWKTISLGCEGSLDPDEDWMLALQGAYSQLTVQLRQLWQQNGAPEHSKNGPTMPVAGSWEEIEEIPPSSAKAGAREHWCSEHEMAFKRFEKDGKAWYSHKGPDGWCKEQPVLKGVT